MVIYLSTLLSYLNEICISEDLEKLNVGYLGSNRLYMLSKPKFAFGGEHSVKVHTFTLETDLSLILSSTKLFLETHFRDNFKSAHMYLKLSAEN